MKKNIIIIIAAALVALGFMSTRVIDTSDEQTIKVGMSGGYKPYTFIDESGELKGFDVDVWTEIAKRIDHNVEFETSDFSGLFGKLDSNQISTIANQITTTEKRKEKYNFTKPYVYYGAQLIVKEGNHSITNLESLKGKSVGVSLGSNYEEMIKKYDTDNQITVVTYENFQGSLQDVSNGRLDAVLNDRLAGLIAIEESGLELEFGGKPIEILHNAFPFVKNEKNEALVEQVNTAIEQMYEDGTMEEISLKWFPVDITQVLGE